MTIRQVPFDDLGLVDFVPQAVVRSPIAYFSDHLGYTFRTECDDLDEYQGAFFTLDNEIPFALIHYRGNPDDRTTIYMNRTLSGESAVRIIRRIVSDFDLPDAATEWVRR